MARYRDVNSVTLLGEAITGVQSVRVGGEATEIEYEGDDDAGVQDIGVTKRFISISVEVKDSTKRRDIRDPQFTSTAPVTTALNEVQGIDIGLEGQPVQDSAEKDTWLTYIGVRSVKASVDVALRDVGQVVDDSGVFFIGVRGKIDFDLQAPLSTAGLPDSSALTNTEIDNLVLVGVEGNTPHGELADGRLRFSGHGAGGAAPLITSTAIPKTVGATGSVVFTAVSATGGADKTITISNCVLVRIRARAVHGDIFQVTYELQAFSSDGVASPVAVA